ncbi:hypothetical protein D9M68_677300 [compost metagenome]
MQAKVGDSALVDFGQLLEDLGYGLLGMLPGGAALDLAVTAVTDVIRVVTSGLGGTLTSASIGEYWENVANSFENSLTALDTFYTNIVGDHGRLLAFYSYSDNGNLPIPGSNGSNDYQASVASTMANGLMLQAYQTLMQLFWGVGWAAPAQFSGNQALYGDYIPLTITRAPDGTYVEGPYYEFALIWSTSHAVKYYPTQPMMTDLTVTLNVNLMDILARTDPWLGVSAWFSWVSGQAVVMQGPYTR